MNFCQHGNEQAACEVVCGINFCGHPCREHAPYEPKLGEVVDDDEACWVIRRECRREGCDCGVFLNPATEEQARVFGRSFGADLARDFKQGENFTWNKFERSVRSMSVTQWGLAARCGHEHIVEEEAVAAWRAAK